MSLFHMDMALLGTVHNGLYSSSSKAFVVILSVRHLLILTLILHQALGSLVTQNTPIDRQQGSPSGTIYIYYILGWPTLSVDDAALCGDIGTGVAPVVFLQCEN